MCEVYVENNASYNFIKSMGFEEYDIKIYNSDNFHWKLKKGKLITIFIKIMNRIKFSN